MIFFVQISQIYSEHHVTDLTQGTLRYIKACPETIEKRPKNGNMKWISSRIINNPNVFCIEKAQKFKMVRAIVQTELAPRNNFDQFISLEDQAEHREIYWALSNGLGDHKTDVIFIQGICSRVKDSGNAFETIRKNSRRARCEKFIVWVYDRPYISRKSRKF